MTDAEYEMKKKQFFEGYWGFLYAFFSFFAACYYMWLVEWNEATRRQGLQEVFWNPDAPVSSVIVIVILIFFLIGIVAWLIVVGLYLAIVGGVSTVIAFGSPFAANLFGVVAIIVPICLAVGVAVQHVNKTIGFREPFERTVGWLLDTPVQEQDTEETKGSVKRDLLMEEGEMKTEDDIRQEINAIMTRTGTSLMVEPPLPNQNIGTWFESIRTRAQYQRKTRETDDLTELLEALGNAHQSYLAIIRTRSAIKHMQLEDDVRKESLLAQKSEHQRTRIENEMYIQELNEGSDIDRRLKKIRKLEKKRAKWLAKENRKDNPNPDVIESINDMFDTERENLES